MGNSRDGRAVEPARYRDGDADVSTAESRHRVGAAELPVCWGYRTRERVQCFLLGVDTVRRLRPFRRRRRSTSRPCGVDIRLRKPWLRRRLTRDGW